MSHVYNWPVSKQIPIIFILIMLLTGILLGLLFAIVDGKQKPELNPCRRQGSNSPVATCTAHGMSQRGSDVVIIFRPMLLSNLKVGGNTSAEETSIAAIARMVLHKKTRTVRVNIWTMKRLKIGVMIQMNSIVAQWCMTISPISMIPRSNVKKSVTWF